MNKTLKRILGLSVIIIVIGLIGVNYLVSLERVDAGHVGIKVNLVGSERGIDDITEVTGWVLYLPLLTEIIEFPVFTQVKDYEKFKVNAKDGSEFLVDPTLTYFVNSSQVPKLFRQYRKMLPEIENGVVLGQVKDSYRIVANSFTSDSLMSNRDVFETQVQKQISDTFDEMGLVFQGVTSNLEPPESLRKAVDAKNIVNQEALLAENKIRQAEADAKARKIKADIEKYENDMKSISLNKLILEKAFIDKWDGKLPVYGEVPVMLKEITK